MRFTKRRSFVTMAIVLAFSTIFYQNCSPFSSVAPVAETPDQNRSATDVEEGVPEVEIVTTESLFKVTDVAFSFKFAKAGASPVVTCQLDERAPVDCAAGSVRLSEIEQGSHTLFIKVRTRSNFEREVRKVFIVDTEKPVLAVMSAPSAVSDGSADTFNFAAEDAASGVEKIECAFDSLTFETCTSPKKLGKLEAKSHRMMIRAIDRAGHLSDVYTYTWTVDPEAPSVRITSTPPAFTKSGAASFSFAGTKVSSFECRVDKSGGEPYSACVSGIAFDLSEGPHKFEVRGVTSAGAKTEAQAYSWSIDRTPPAKPVVTLSVPDLTNSRAAVATFKSSASGTWDADTFECSLNDSAFIACANPYAFEVVKDGTSTLLVRAKDRAGNVSEAGRKMWELDTSPPGIPFIVSNSVRVSPTTLRSAVFDFELNQEIGDRATCSINGRSLGACKPVLRLTENEITEGEQTLSIYSYDKAGNRSAVDATFRWIVDTKTTPSAPEYFSTKYGSIRNQGFTTITTDTGATQPIILSACGAFRSGDGGSTFSAFNQRFPKSTVKSVAVSGSLIVLGATDGLYISNDNGTNFVRALDATKVNEILRTQVPTARPCSQTFFNNLVIKQVAIKGNTIIAAGDSFIWVSQDAGRSFKLASITSSGFSYSPVGEITSLIVQEDKIVVSMKVFAHINLAAIRIGGTACELTGKAVRTGVLVSTDNGASFKAVEAAGVNLQSAMYTSKNSIVAFGADAERVKNELRYSDDGGVTFSNRSLDPDVFKTAKVGTISHQPLSLFAELRSALYFHYYFSTNGYRTNLVKSIDGGKSWSPTANTPDEVSGELLIGGIANIDQKLGIISNQGFAVFDEGANSVKTKAKFKSAFCAYPWWDGLTVAAAEGEKIFAVRNNIAFFSNDGGKTFREVALIGMKSVIRDVYIVDGVIVAYPSREEGVQISTDGGDTFGAPIPEYRDAKTGTVYRAYQGAGPQNRSYISVNGGDVRSTFGPEKSEYQMAVTIGARTIVTTATDIIVFENGVEVSRERDVMLSGSQWIRYIDGKLFVTGAYMLISNDLGRTFQRTDMFYMYDIWKVGGRLQTATQTGGYLWESRDQGATFTPWTSELK